MQLTLVDSLQWFLYGLINDGVVAVFLWFSRHLCRFSENHLLQGYMVVKYHRSNWVLTTSWSKSILCAQSVIIENFSGLLGKSFADQMVVNIQTGQISSIPRQYGVFIFPRALVVLKMVKYLLCLTYLRSSFGKSYSLSICGLYLHELHSLLFDLRQQTCFWLSKA